VIKARTWFTLFIVSLATVAATASCGSSDEATGGPSAGASGVAGGSIIAGAGRAVGRAGASSVSGGGGGGNVGSSTLGIACTADTQCGEGMVCAKANGTAFGDGGPSHGMCTMSCASNIECDAISAGALCLDFGTTADPQGYCLDGCVQGDPAGDLSTKCAGRSDFVCMDVGQDSVQTVCVPHCRSDAECGSGLFCDKTSPLGLCSKTKPPAGDPVGTPCTPSTSTNPVPNTCEGYCIRTSADNVTPVTGACVELCADGFECMYGSGSAPKPGGLCGGQLTSADFGALDLGYCLPNCSCTGDCKLDGDLCRKWPAADADLASLLGAPGVCFPVVSQSVELTCGEGGAGGAGGAGGDGAGGAGGDAVIPEAGGASGSN